MWIAIGIIVAAAGLVGLGWAIGRNNPNLKVVNNLIAKGTHIITATGQIIKKL